MYVQGNISKQTSSRNNKKQELIDHPSGTYLQKIYKLVGTC